MSAFLSRARLREEAGLEALGPVLLPRDENKRIGVSHRLVWTLFPSTPDAKRDFLWREERPGRFMVLSAREPAPSALWEVETRPFAPEIATGDPLLFRLRVNATVTTAKPDEKGPRRHDLVMHALRTVPPGERARPRARALGWLEDEEGHGLPPGPPRDWLEAQGGKHGFDVEELAVLGYDVVRLPRDEAKGRRVNDVRFAALEMEGRLRVTRPEAFLAKLLAGFGRSKAFGCGLMLVKRPAAAHDPSGAS